MAKRKQMFGIVEVTGLKQPKKEKSTLPAAEQTPKAIAARKEFAAASTATKTFKDSLGPHYHEVADNNYFATLQAKMRAVITKGEPSPSGPRSIDLSLHKDSFRGLETNKKKRFGSFIYAHFDIEVAPDRKTITLDFGTFHPEDCINAPKSATDFQITLCIGIFSDMIYDEYLETYRPKHPALHGIAEQTSSTQYSTRGLCNITIYHTLQACPDTELPADATLVVAIATQCFQIVNGFQCRVSPGHTFLIHELY